MAAPVHSACLVGSPQWPDNPSDEDAPLAASHGHRVEILVELVEQADALNDHIIDTVHVELDLQRNAKYLQKIYKNIDTVYIEPGLQKNATYRRK